MSTPRDRSKFVNLIANGEILSGVTSPADRHNLIMFCEDYEKLRKERDEFLKRKLELAVEHKLLSGKLSLAIEKVRELSENIHNERCGFECKNMECVEKDVEEIRGSSEPT